MRPLKVCLWVAAVVCLLSVVGLFLPAAAFESFARMTGADTLPDSPVVWYGLRVMSATYVVIGAFLLILARDPVKYGPLVPFSGVAAVFLGFVCGISGFGSHMPLFWFLGDSLSLMAFGILALALWRRATTAK